MHTVVVESILTGSREEMEVCLGKGKSSTLTFDAIEGIGIIPEVYKINGQIEYSCNALIHPEGNKQPHIATGISLVTSVDGVDGTLGYPVFVEVANPFSVEWGNYLQLPPESVERLKDRAWEENKDWIREQLEAFGAEWILVCDREVIKWSDDLRKFPSQEELKKIAEEKKLFPFVFSQPPLIEESDWSKTEYKNDYYPTLKINVCGNVELTADFDTGATNTVLDIDQLISHDLLMGIFATFSEAKHLNRTYKYSHGRVCIEITDERGNRESGSLICTCVKNWEDSPFCEINPDRKALVGRDILLEFPLEVRLDGKEKKTYIYIL